MKEMKDLDLEKEVVKISKKLAGKVKFTLPFNKLNYKKYDTQNVKVIKELIADLQHQLKVIQELRSRGYTLGEIAELEYHTL